MKKEEVLLKNLFWFPSLFLIFHLLVSNSDLGFSVEIPINIGLGPTAMKFSGPMDESDETYYLGLKLDIAAVVTKEVIKKKKGKIPKKYRKMAEKIGEAKISHMLIPKNIVFASNSEDSSVYGATWQPLGIGAPIRAGILSLRLSLGLVFSYYYLSHEKYSESWNAKITSSTSGNESTLPSKSQSTTNQESELEKIENETHFLRPGLSLGLDFEIKFHKRFLTNVGIQSTFYIPQKIGGGVFSFPGEDAKGIFRTDEIMLVFHARFPYDAKL